MRRSSSSSLIALLVTSWCSIAGAQTPEGTARVHLVADSPDATLHRYHGPRSSKPICRPPCDRVLDANAETAYFIAGEDIAPSRPFTLAGRSGDVTLDVKAKSVMMRAHGIVLIALGGAALIGGEMLLMFGSMGDESAQLFGRRQDPPRESGMIVAGGVALGSGVAMIAGGVVALVFSKTRVNISRLEPSPAGLSFRF